MNANSSHARIQKCLNIAATVACSLPVLAFLVLRMLVRPDLESWLSERYAGFGRGDAFDGLNGVLPAFSVILLITSACVCYRTYLRKWRYFVSLVTGPLVCTFAYLVTYGITDPAWMSLLALNTIGMFVSFVVTGGWILLSHFGSKKPYGVVGGGEKRNER